MFIAPKLMADLLEADQLLQEGDKLYAQGDFYSAIDTYTKSLEIHQKSKNFKGEAKAFHKIAGVYQSFGEWAVYDAEKLLFNDLIRRRSQESGEGQPSIQIPPPPADTPPQTRNR